MSKLGFMERFCCLCWALWIDWLSILVLGINFAIMSGFSGSDLLHGLCFGDWFCCPD